MPGSAILGANLVDELVPMIDELRGDLHSAMGVRQFRVYLVKRRWSGTCRGEGTPTFVYQNEITPQPKVDLLSALETFGVQFRQTEFGREEEGDIFVTEVSFTYTEAELLGGTLANNEEFYYRLVDAYGQGIQTRYFIPSRPPESDRVKTMGYRLQLRRVEISE